MYAKAAAKNYSAAQFNLALMYYEGKMVKKSVENSFIWNTIASYNGHQDAAKSRKIDQRELSSAQVKSAKQKADTMYLQIKDGSLIPPNRR